MTTVSLIVCSRDRPELLASLLESLAAADLTSVREVLLVDQSAPGTYADLVRDQAERLPLRHVPTDTAGLSVARNLGVARAEGEVCLFTDDDCTVDPGWVRAVRIAFTDPVVDAVVGAVLPAPGEGKEGDGTQVAVREGLRARRVAGRANPFRIGSGNNMAFRTAVLRHLGGFLEDLGAGTPAASGEDAEMFMRFLARGGTVAVVPEAVVRHRPWRDEAALLATKRGYFHGAAYFLTRAARRGDGYALGLLVRRLAGEVLLPALGALAGGGRTRRRLQWAQLAGSFTGLAAGLSAPPARPPVLE